MKGRHLSAEMSCLNFFGISSQKDAAASEEKLLVSGMLLTTSIYSSRPHGLTS